MKLISFLLRPLKMLFFLLVLLTLIYFRNVIFLPNINQYVDTAQAYIENKLVITIPVYVNKNIVEAAVADPAKSSELSDELCKNNDVIESKITVDVAPVAITGSNSTDSVGQPTDLIEPSLETKLPVDVVITKAVVDSVEAIAQLDLLTQLSETVNALNTKVDKLFDAGKASVETAEKSTDKMEEKSNVEAAQPSTKNIILDDEAANSNDAKRNVHLTEDAKNMFYMARQTYWMGDALGAEKIYLKLAVVEDDNPDIYGELGNVYYAQGKWNDAGKAYYEAAIRLLNLDRNNQVNYLLRVIQGLDTDSAEKLKQKISS